MEITAIAMTNTQAIAEKAKVPVQLLVMCDGYLCIDESANGLLLFHVMQSVVVVTYETQSERAIDSQTSRLRHDQFDAGARGMIPRPS
ncbi:MAG TPA: hypothetical protein DHV68_02300 [Dehalococcoidia bacterium]|nr:hypothetical protein [Chloroflexota bacterium]HCI85658.1 hypothetical protein [Dehalococcoidia bacterium]